MSGEQWSLAAMAKRGEENQFNFTLTEDFLHAYAAYLTQLRLANPGKAYVVSLSMDLEPIDVVFKASNLQISVEEVKE